MRLPLRKRTNEQTHAHPGERPGRGVRGAGALVSLWQTNSVGILCERYITWLVARADAVQVRFVVVAVNP